jgi:hypothetical protein
MSVLSVIHSLIFQLAQKDPNLQDVVRSTDRNPLEFDLQSAIKLLTDLVACSGPVRFAIDGLDEIKSLAKFDVSLLLTRDVPLCSSHFEELGVPLHRR